MSEPIPVIDLFAGPGGLGEGFSSLVEDSRRAAFHIGLSIEMDRDAHTTLELRSFFRQFPPGHAPNDYYAHLRRELSREDLFARFPKEAAIARQEAWLAELGKIPTRELNQRIRGAIDSRREWVLCGGPPCQAYSVVGRSRRGGIDHADNRLYLYREYLEILAEHKPPVFIMENVKGLLSSTVKEGALFSRLIADLQSPAESIGSSAGGAKYFIHSLVRPARAYDLLGNPKLAPRDFIIKSEDFGIPQSRHRVILLGVREDLAHRRIPSLTTSNREIPISRVLQGLPKLRSGLSRSSDGAKEWRDSLRELTTSGALHSLPNGHYKLLNEAILESLDKITNYRADRGGEFVSGSPSIGYRPDWFLDDRIGGVVNHLTRPHMASDLHRYLFATAYAKALGKSPELRDFPTALLPAHRNVKQAGKENFFDDRFRVQVANRPATTITCHLAKDGHYYIHYDPTQCRSLTVREAARVQTFPDNYLFCGTRTAQYKQVGNAVPPLLATQIAQIVLDVLLP